MARLNTNRIALVASVGLLVACGGETGRPDSSNGGRGGDGSGAGSGNGPGGLDVDIDPGGNGGGSGGFIDNPKTCEQAAEARSYVGCEFWPTVTYNPVFLEFDFAVVVANGQEEDADITFEGPGGFTHSETVPAGGLSTVLLPWVDTLKGPLWNPNSSGGRVDHSSFEEGGAYRLKASVPVTAWQFNPLQYQKADKRAASNDASLLLPTTAMTGNYRVAAYSNSGGHADWGGTPSAVAITATQDGTKVTIELAESCAMVWAATDEGCLLAGGGMVERHGGEVFTVDMNAGDVLQLQAKYGLTQVPHADLSGSVINATAPVQVIALNAITPVPAESKNADHMESTVLPAEVIGKKYIVTPPTAFGGSPVGHFVRIYGNVDGTQLTYTGTRPPGAPDTINAGEFVQLPPPTTNHQCPRDGAGDVIVDECEMIKEPFVVEGTEPFMVASFMLAGEIQVPDYPEGVQAAPGDPAFTMLVTPEQFRKEYTFLAPVDFMENYADILVPEGAEVTLDGAPLTGTAQPIADSGWSIVRALLSDSGGGIHKLETSDERGVGLQVMGFGNATSYYYPGGLNLKLISEPPVIIVR